MTPIPNKFPDWFPSSSTTPYRVAIIGESISKDDSIYARPFSGTAGNLLDGLLSNAGINRSSCFVGNVCQLQAPGGEIVRFKWLGPEIQTGLTQLRADLMQFRPTFIILLGGAPLRAFHHLGKEAKIDNWRGSLFMSNFLDYPVKCMTTYHPVNVLRTYGEMIGVVKFDLKRAAKERLTETIAERKLNIEINLSLEVLLEKLADIRVNKRTVSTDLEGFCTGVSCIGFATSPTDCFVVPFERTDDTSYWSESEEVVLWEAVAAVLEDTNVIKICHNILYEKFVLGWCYGINLVNGSEDTMVKHFELFCEMEKSLAFCASIYTDQSYYKGDRKSLNDQVALTYNALDCLVTYEINEVMNQHITEAQLRHYRFNISCLNALTYMSLRGIRYDRDAALASATTLQSQIYELQHQLNCEAGLAFPDNETDLIQMAAKALCRKNPKRKTTITIEGKRGPRQKEVNTPVSITTWEEVTEFCKESQTEALRCLVEIVLGKTSATGLVELDAAAMGELSSLLEMHLNIDSTDQLGDFLYVKKGLPKQFIKEGNKNTDRTTTNALALVNLYKKEKDPTVKLILTLRNLMTQIETLKAETDSDGRIRCGYNLVGTDTSRLSCYESPTGSGFNLQTVTKKHRHLFKADEGMLMAQCDLAGADGWTVGSRAAQQGDRTMLDDYLFGIKPAKIVALIYERGSGVNQLPREQLKQEAKSIDGDGWLYFACKRVQHSSSYMVGKMTMSDQILKDSYKLTGEPVYVEPRTCEAIQKLAFFVRYPGILRWHDWMKRQLKSVGYIETSVGHRRMFFGRKDDADTIKAALAHEPQFWTTYATKRALWRLWHDTANRNGDGSFIVEPIHTVHDSLNSMFPAPQKDFAKAKLREWFNNPIQIAGETIVIPFEGTVGADWGMKNAEII